MNYAIILTGGVGQRMKNTGLPKQFLKLMGKPILVYTLEKFQLCKNIHEIILVSHGDYIELTEKLIKQYSLDKVKYVVKGGKSRTESILSGLSVIKKTHAINDIVMIHDGVRPLVDSETIEKNITVAKINGNAMTVRQVNETVVVAEKNFVQNDNFLNREMTYTLTSPQTFKVVELLDAYSKLSNVDTNKNLPILDPSMLYTRLDKKVYLVIEKGLNLKVTTPEDFYYLKSILELEENKYIFCL